MSQEFKINKFDMKRIEDGKIILAIGKRMTGKSYCVRDLLFHKRKIPLARVLSGTERANAFYGDFVPPVCISFDYDESIINKFMTRQRELKTKKHLEPSYKDLDSRALLILDDLMFAKDEWVKSSDIKEIFMNGRHYDITFILTLQYCLGIPPALRNNTDFIFIFRENRPMERKKLYDHWCGVIPTFEMFNKLMDKCTNDYGCLVIDNNCKSNRFEDQVYWYKATDNGPFKMCDPRLWNLSNPNAVTATKENKPSKHSQVPQKKYKIVLEK